MISTVQLNLNLTFTHVWHVSFWTNFSCHSRVTHEKIIKMYIYTRVTLESLDKFIRSIASCMRSEQINLATCELHMGTEQICCTTCELHSSTWSNALVKCATHEEHTYDVMCQMHTCVATAPLNQTATNHRVVY